MPFSGEGDKLFTAFDQIVAHPGGGQTNAVLLVKPLSKVDTVAADHDSVMLPPASSGMRWNVVNNGAHILDIYPSFGQQILGQSVNAPVSVAAGQEGNFSCYNSTPGAWWQTPSSVGSSLTVTDGSTTISSATEISFSGATVSSGGAGVADVAVSGGTASPLPFFGNQSNTPWVRPSLATFSTALNQGHVATQTGSDAPTYNDGTPITGGTGYAMNDTITVAGGAGASPATVLTVDSVDGGGAILGLHVSTFGQYATAPSNPASQAITSGMGSGATFGLAYSSAATLTDNVGGLPLVFLVDNSGNPGQNLSSYLNGILKAKGAPPWTITVALAGISNFNTRGPWVPIILYNSVGDKAVVVWWSYYNAPTVFASVYHYDGTLGTNAPSLVGQGGLSFPDYFAWFRVENDGTTLTFSVSQEGLLFLPFYQEAANALVGSFDKVGFGIDRTLINATPFQQQASALWSWVES